MIEIKNLTKKFGRITAVDNISFTINDGEIVGFLGPNGAGKSTTMNIMTGFISATEGSVSVNGYDILDEPEKAKRQIGYLPELPPLYPEMTVWEYLNFVCDIKKIKKSERQVMLGDIIRSVKLSDVRNRVIKNLSKGYRQRVGLAQALVGYPDILILDEPTVGLDPGQVLEMREVIKTLGKSHTVILSSHILQEVNAVCDRVIIINKGKLIVDSPADRLSAETEGSRITLEVKGSREELEDMLNNMEEIASYTITKEIKATSYNDSDVTDEEETEIGGNKAYEEETEIGENKTADELSAEGEKIGEVSEINEEASSEADEDIPEALAPVSVWADIEGADGRDIREDIFRSCCERNLVILSLKPTDLSLEEIFMQAVNGSMEEEELKKAALETKDSESSDSETAPEAEISESSDSETAPEAEISGNADSFDSDSDNPQTEEDTGSEKSESALGELLPENNENNSEEEVKDDSDL